MAVPYRPRGGPGRGIGSEPQRGIGKLKYLAGSESGMGVFINDATPESIARKLREIELPPN